MSPTINLKFCDTDFVKFVSNLKYYIGLELKFIDNEKDYPVAELGDIKLQFLHYSSANEAKDAWERRKARINFENVYIILFDRGGLGIDDYEKIDGLNCKDKIVFTSNDNPKYGFYEKMTNLSNVILYKKDENGIMDLEKQWDYVSFLNN